MILDVSRFVWFLEFWCLAFATPLRGLDERAAMPD
jgi:hypothetical protein